MKKIILILLLILPVAISLIAYILAGFIGREIAYVGVDRVVFNANPGGGQPSFFMGADNKIYQGPLDLGQTVDLRGRLTIHSTVEGRHGRWEQLIIDIIPSNGATGDEISLNMVTGIITTNAITYGVIDIQISYDMRVLFTLSITNIRP